MSEFDGKAFGEEIVQVVRSYVDRSMAPIVARVGAMEARLDAIREPKDGIDGKDADPAKAAALARQELAGELQTIRNMIEALPEAPELPDIPSLVAEAVRAEVAALPPAEQGPKGEPGEPGRDGLDGKDADPEEIANRLMPEIERAVSAIPTPKDGKDGRDGIDGKDGAPGENADAHAVAEVLKSDAEFCKTVKGEPGARGEKGDTGAPGKDGIGLAGGFVNRDGQLILTLSDGSAHVLGVVVGKDGQHGQPGKDGADGVGFDDIDLVDTSEGVFLRCARGERVKEWRLPVVRDCNVWRPTITYRRGDGVTWGGSFWIAQGETKGDKPDRGCKSWRLAVKRGQDGKDGGTKGGE